MEPSKLSFKVLKQGSQEKSIIDGEGPIIEP